MLDKIVLDLQGGIHLASQWILKEKEKKSHDVELILLVIYYLYYYIQAQSHLTH